MEMCEKSLVTVQQGEREGKEGMRVVFAPSLLSPLPLPSHIFLHLFSPLKSPLSLPFSLSQFSPSLSALPSIYPCLTPPPSPLPYLCHRSLSHRPRYILWVQRACSYDRHVVLHGTQGQGTPPHTHSIYMHIIQIALYFFSFFIKFKVFTSFLFNVILHIAIFKSEIVRSNE